LPYLFGMAKIWVVLFSVFLLGCYVGAKERESPEEQRKKLEPYMRDMVRLQSSRRPGYYRIVSNDYSYRYKDESKFGFVFDGIIGSIVHAGYKTRQYHLNAPHPCVGLKKLYLYWQNQTGDYRLTTNYLDVHNKGDRQPIGMCGAYQGHCGADLPLREYTQKIPNGQGSYYGTSAENNLNVDLNEGQTVCHIFSRSKEQSEREAQIAAENNFKWGTYYDRLIHIYSIFTNTSTIYYNRENAIAKSKELNIAYQFAFNLIRKEVHEEIAKVCDLRPIAQYSNDSGVTTVLFDDPERDSELRNKGFKPYPNEAAYILGYGLQKYHYCGSHVQYLIQQRPFNDEVRAVPAQYVGAYNVSFHGGFFYSL